MRSVWAGLTVAVLLGGCAATGRSSKASADEGPQPGDEAAMEQALSELQQQKNAATVPKAHNDCQAVCKIADLICEATDRICTIAGRHRGNDAYLKKCRGADADCKAANVDCERCTDRL